MIGIGGIIDGKAAIHSRQIQVDILSPLVSQKPRQVDRLGRNSGADIETIVTGPGQIVLEDIAAEVDTGRVQTLFVPDGFAFESPFVGRLIPCNHDEFLEIARYQPSYKWTLEGKAIWYKQGLDSAGVNFESP